MIVEKLSFDPNNRRQLFFQKSDSELQIEFIEIYFGNIRAFLIVYNKNMLKYVKIKNSNSYSFFIFSKIFVFVCVPFLRRISISARCNR